MIQFTFSASSNDFAEERVIHVAETDFIRFVCLSSGVKGF